VNRVRFNVAANIAGQVWSVLLAIICTPFKLLGIEGYALIATSGAALSANQVRSTIHQLTGIRF